MTAETPYRHLPLPLVFTEQDAARELQTWKWEVYPWWFSVTPNRDMSRVFVSVENPNSDTTWWGDVFSMEVTFAQIACQVHVLHVEGIISVDNDGRISLEDMDTVMQSLTLGEVSW